MRKRGKIGSRYSVSDDSRAHARTGQIALAIGDRGRGRRPLRRPPQERPQGRLHARMMSGGLRSAEYCGGDSDQGGKNRPGRE